MELTQYADSDGLSAEGAENLMGGDKGKHTLGCVSLSRHLGGVSGEEQKSVRGRLLTVTRQQPDAWRKTSRVAARAEKTEEGPGNQIAGTLRV